MGMLLNSYMVASAAPFSPLSIPNLALWLDASDASTITQTAGSVIQWNDKSGNARHFVQATASRQPLYVPANNLIRFSTAGSSDVLANATVLSTQNITIMSVNSWASSIDYGNTVIAQDGEAGNGWQWRGHNGTPQFGVRGTAGDDNGSYSGAVTFNQEYIFANRYNNTAATRMGWRDGTGKLNYTSDSGTIPYSANGLSVGGNSGGATGNMNGDIKEIILFTTALTNAQINQLGAYLQSKWGITWTNI